MDDDTLRILEDEEDHTVLFFRLSIDLGNTIDTYRQPITCLPEPNQSLFSFINKKSWDWADSHVDSLWNLSEYSAYLRFVRNNIENDINNMHLIYQNDKQKQDAATNALQLIFSALSKESTAKETAHRLETKAKESYQVLSKMISKFGTTRSQSRWNSCGEALIIFDKGATTTKCYFQRAESPENTTASADRIVVQIGNHMDPQQSRKKGAVRVYFLLDFYFLHEYLSHSYTCEHWQSETYFTEGYLYWAAREIMWYAKPDVLKCTFFDDAYWDISSNDSEYSSLSYVKPISTAVKVLLPNDLFMVFLLDLAASPCDRALPSLKVFFASLQSLLDGMQGHDKLAESIVKAFSCRDAHEVISEVDRSYRTYFATPSWQNRV